MIRVTLADIARATGFSINTVSRALNGKPDVREQTRTLIQAAARELNYHPDRLARGLRQQATRVIGLVVSDVANPFFGALMKSISRHACARDYQVLLQDSDENSALESNAIDVLLGERIDGVLICPVQVETASIERLMASGLPVVLVGRHFQDLDMDYVSPDDTQGGRLAAQHLLQLGHRRIGMINASPWISSARDRHEGFVQAHAEANVTVDSDLIRTGVVDHLAGYREARTLLREHPDLTAIVAYSDFVAFGVARAIWEAGLSIPKDISLVGFDDTPLATCLPVPLSTVRTPVEQLGSRSVDVLCKKIEGGDSSPVREALPMVFVERSSSARYPQEGIT